MKSSLVAIVDDDESVRESLPHLLRELGHAPTAFASAGEFLSAAILPHTQCLILDIAMPEMSGPELQQELVRRGLSIPVIFITAQTDPAVRAAVLAQGAVACLFKPFSAEELQTALAAALHGG